MPVKRIGDYDFHYAVRGTGPPLVLVHGTLCDYRIWRAQMAPFGAQYRTIAISLRHAWPARWDGKGGGFTIARHTADIAGFIRSLDAGPVHLLGHSRGGQVAFRVAQRFPHLVNRLILAEPGDLVADDLALTPSVEPPDDPEMPPSNEIPALIRQRKYDVVLKPMTREISGPSGWDRLPPPMKAMLRSNMQTLPALMRERIAPFTRSDATSIQAPTLLLAGGRTRTGFKRVVAALAAAIPLGRQVQIARAWHLSNLDNPTGFQDAVLRFLRPSPAA